ncbi:MAG: imidazolonepropionase [Gammaproteobacteria bacterium]|nr:imidazolonepropionase [Gammaproteobacteria bacterium]
MLYDLVIKNAHLAVMDEAYTVYPCAHVCIIDDEIAEIVTDGRVLEAKYVLDARGRLVTPGLIDCHTHLVYAGSRASEFAKRLEGVSYEDISKQGGGIRSTVAATRDCSEDELTQLTQARAEMMLKQGTTTIEIKSGYGLNLETEVKQLNVVSSLKNSLPMTVISTFLALHAMPAEYQDKEAYVDDVIQNILPVVASKYLAVFVDAFCESIGFTSAQVERLFHAATELGLKLKLHAEQLSNQQGAVLAARYHAYSVDHLEYLAESDCEKLQNQRTVAVLLPGAFYFLKEKKCPPVKALRENNIPIAIATDANPGTSPFLTLPLMMNMACIFFGLSIKEAWRGVTLNAAKALDCEAERGSLEIGKKADLVIWSCDSLEEVVYSPSAINCDVVIQSGSIV